MEKYHRAAKKSPVLAKSGRVEKKKNEINNLVLKVLYYFLSLNCLKLSFLPQLVMNS